MTTVQLFTDIGLYANYKQTVDFTSVTAQNTWFNNKTHTTINNVIYNKAYNSLKLNIDYGTALTYTYCRLIDLDNTGRIYYYFINTVNVIDDNTVEFILEMDVIQTFMTYWNLRESMVNRAHIDRWSNENDIPARITPNVENINCIYYSESVNRYVRKPSLGSSVEMWFAYIIRKKDTDLVMDISPVAINFDDLGQTRAVFYKNFTESEGGILEYPAIDDFGSNTVLNTFEIDPESVICMGISPIGIRQYVPSMRIIAGVQGEFWYIDFSNVDYIKSTTECMAEISLTGEYGRGSYADNLFIQTLIINTVKPVKPTDGATASDTFEPALYMYPYRQRMLMNSNGSMNMQVPDVVLADEEIVSFFHLFSASSQLLIAVVGNQLDNVSADTLASEYSEGSLYAFMLDSIDVFNNAWLTYMLTQRDSDRQIVNNNAISSVLQGLLFGAYGGALVTSRGTGGKDVRSLGKMATRMVPGIALGGVASAGAAIIDSHFAWENQLLNEQKIQNKAQTISISGTNGISNAVSGLSSPTFQVLKCDDTNYNRAYDNFRKYGYMINEFTELNIRSRKYYNYVMTNGAVIGGSLPEDARAIIASAFDAGITIFHGDYCSTLEYPTQENIERSLM